jgi:tripartite motif-containing protein 2/3/tripartite motif-containing protein 71
VKKAAPAIKEKLAERLAPLKEIQASLCNTTKSVKSAKSDIEKQGATVTASIEQSFQELHEIIERRKRELLERTSSLVKGKFDRLNVQEKEFEIVSGTIQSLVEFVEQNIENATKEELVIIHTQILDRIDEETKKHQQSSAADLKPMEEADILVGVECAEELKTLCQEKAVVTTSPADLFKLIVPEDGIRNAVVDEASKVKLQVLSCHMRHKKPVVVKATLTSSVTGAVVPAKVQQKSDDTYEIEYTPSVHGRHHLKVTIGDLPVAGSPFPVVVHIPPTQLGKPLKIIPDLEGLGITFNSRGELVFAERDGDILFFDKGGDPSHRITKSQHGFQSLFGIAVDDDDNVYVTEDGSGSIFKFDKQCVKIKAIKPAIKGFTPRGIAVFGDYVIVADAMANHQLLVFTRDLMLEKTIDCQTGQAVAVGVACDQDGNIYLCNYGDNCIQVFNTQGVLLYSFGEKGSSSYKLDSPHSICISGDFVYVTEWGDADCVSVFTKKGKFITSFGNKGNKEGEVGRPSGLAMDSDGVLYVCDFDNKRLQLF